MCLGIFSFQAKSSSKILTFQVLGNCFFFTHYLLLGLTSEGSSAYVGAILNLFAVVRNGTYYYLGKKNKSGEIYYAAFFCVLCIGLSILTYADWRSLLPMVGSAIQSFSFACKKANKLRFFTLLGSPFWLIYNILLLSYSGIITETLCIVSMIVGIWRYRNVTEREDSKKSV